MFKLFQAKANREVKMSFFKKLFSFAKPKDDYVNDLGELTDDGKQGIMLIAISGNFRALEKLLSHSKKRPPVREHLPTRPR